MIQLKRIILLITFMSMLFSTAFSYDIAVKNMDGVTIYYLKSSDYGELIVCQNESTDNSYSGRVVIPESIEYDNEIYMVTAIGNYAFEECDALTSVTIPSTITTIGCGAFLGCTGLTSVSIPNSVKYIDGGAFSCCTKLTSVTIPNSVTTIYDCTFERCSSLTSVIIPNSVKNIDGNPFVGCESLASINVDENNTKYDSRQGCNAIIETSSNRLIAGCKNSIIPSTVTSIGSNAFANCYGLTSVAFPNSVTTIEEYAFYNCNDLISLTIPSSVTFIGLEAFYGTAWYNCQPDGLVYAGKLAYHYKGTMPQETNVVINEGTTGIVPYAFTNCRGLTSVSIPNSVKSIGSQAFYGCVCLTSVSIPNSVTKLGDYAFADCTDLTSIISEIEDPFSIGEDVFTYYDNGTRKPLTATLYVPAGCKAAYEAATGWNLLNIVEIEEESEPDTDISVLDNVLYIENTEVTPGNQVVLSVKLKNTIKTIQSFGFNLYLPDGFSFVKDDNGKVVCGMSPERISDENDFFKKADTEDDGSLKVVATGLDAIIDGNDGEVYRVAIQAGEDILPGTYPLYLKKVTVTDINVDPSNYDSIKSSLIVPEYMLGDADGSKALDVSDLTAVVNYMFKHYDRLPKKFNFKAADVAKPVGELDVSDLTGIVNLMFYGTINRPQKAKATNNENNNEPQ